MNISRAFIIEAIDWKIILRIGGIKLITAKPNPREIYIKMENLILENIVVNPNPNKIFC